MNWQLVSLVFDVVIVLMLGGAAFLAVRLGQQLKNFREGRESMDRLLSDLTAQVDRAYKAIEGMRENAKQSGRDLQQSINDAKTICDELQIMVGSADNLAVRLSKAAEKSSKSVIPAIFPQAKKPVSDMGEAHDDVLFNIRDPEFDHEDEHDDFEDESSMTATNMQSRAERDLYEALSRNKKSGSGGRS